MKKIVIELLQQRQLEHIFNWKATILPNQSHNFIFNAKVYTADDL